MLGHTQQTIIEVGYHCFKINLAVWLCQISEAFNLFNWCEWPIIGEEFTRDIPLDKLQQLKKTSFYLFIALM